MLQRRLDTAENVAYWESVEDAAHEVRSNRAYHKVCDPLNCHYGQLYETCDSVIRKHLVRHHPDDRLLDAWELMTTGGVVII